MKPETSDFPIETWEEILESVERLKEYLPKGSDDFAGPYYKLTDDGPSITPEDYFSLWWVAIGWGIPETIFFLKRYPSIKYLRHFSIEEQIRYIREMELFDLPISLDDDNNIITVKRSWMELSESECLLVFEDLMVRNAETLMDEIRRPDKDPVYYSRKRSPEVD